MKTKIVCILSMMAALGLAACGGQPEESSPASQTPTSSNPTSSSRPTSSTPAPSSSTPAPSSSTPAPTSSTPAPVVPTLPAYYVGMPFNSYEGSTRAANDKYKWDKGTTYKWTFNLNKAEEKVVFAIGVTMSNASHSDRTLFVSASGAENSGDSFETDAANQGTPRLSVKINGVDKALTNTATYGENGLNTSTVAYLPLTEFGVQAGPNVVELSTHPQTGFRLYFGDNAEARLYSDDEALQIGDPIIESSEELPPVESSEEPPVESSEEPLVESSEEPPVESSEEPPVESSEEPPVESSEEPPVESSEEPPAPHVHEYANSVTRYNSEGKQVTLKACAEDDAKEISIAYNDGKTLNGKAALETKMEKGAHTEWHINVDKAITGAKIYFEGSAGSNNNRYFFNQNKEVNALNPVTGEEYPDQPSQPTPDGASEDQWRYMVSVGEGTKIAPKNGGTFEEAGAGVGPMYFTDIDLAAGDNVVKLWQMNIGYRLTFTGNVYIRYEGDAVITGLEHQDIAEIVVGEDKIPLKLNAEAASKEYMATKVELDPEKPFAIHVWENDNEVWLHASELKDGVTAAVDSGNENHDIKVTEAGKYDIYIGVADLSETNKYKCIWIAKNTAAAPVTFNWADAIQGDSPLDSKAKWNNNATLTLKVNVTTPGTVVMSWTMKGSDGNGARTINGTGQGFTVKAGAEGALKDGTIVPAGKTYEETFGANQTAWVVVDFAEFEVVEGENIIQITANNGGYRLSVNVNELITLTY